MKHRNHEPKKVQIEKPYVERLAAAGQRGQFTKAEVRFWSKVYRKTIKNPAYLPFVYLYRPKYRFGIRRWSA